MLATLQAQLIAAAICILVGAAGGGWLAWDIQGARLASLRAADAQAEQQRLQQAAQESAKALAIQQQTIGEQNSRIGEIAADRDRVAGLLGSLNGKIAAAAGGNGCGPLRAAGDGLR